jgi:GntR family transcriptional regulator/MocR family aminotransferase
MLSALNCAYLVLPENLTALFAREQMLTQRTTYELSHTAMAYFMAEGHYDRHLRRIRLKYSRRRKLLIENINSKLVGMASIVSSKRTSLIVRVDESIESETILSCAIENGLPCKMTDSLYLVHAPKNEFEISFANVADECFEEMLTAFAKGVSAKRNRLIQTDFAAPAMALPLGAYSFSK